MIGIFVNYYSASLFLGGLAALLSGLAAYLSDIKRPQNKGWMFLNVSAAVWSFGYLTMISVTDKHIAILSNQILHAAAILIPISYFYFSLQLTDTYNRYKSIFITASLLSIFFIIINPTKLFVRDVIPKFIFNYAPDAGPLYIYFTIYFFTLMFFGLAVIYRKLLTSGSNKEKILQLKYLFWVSLFGFAGGGSVFFLTFNINIPPYTIILFSAYSPIIAYAMFRHSFLNVRIIAAELLTFTLWVFLLLRTLLADSFQAFVIDGLLFVITLILGSFLVRSVIKEVEAREQIEKLAKDLEKANARLRELDQLKSEFLSMATHQLRSPLAAIKGYASLVLEGSFGKASPAIEEAVRRIFESSNSLVVTVEDFLNVSRIEQGRMKYESSIFDLGKMAEEVMKELEPNISKKGLKASFRAEGEPKVKADTGKTRQVVANFIDNAVKYTPAGSIFISVSADRARKAARLSVKDTGVGLSRESIEKLFKKFSRADGANQINVSGTGLGLYVAKQMIEAQGGRIWAESEGEGKGSVFSFELPLAGALAAPSREASAGENRPAVSEIHKKRIEELARGL